MSKNPMKPAPGLRCKVCKKNSEECVCRPKKEPKKGINRVSSKQREKLRNKAKQTKSDHDVYMEIWSERQHICENCAKPISEPLSINFHHIAEKRNYPEIRHFKPNIALLCADCHCMVEQSIDKIPTLKDKRTELIEMYCKIINTKRGQNDSE